MTRPASMRESRSALMPWPAWALLVGVTVLLSAANLGGARALTFHEALVVGNAREMLESGDWLVPRICGAAWLEKAPLLQWLIAALMMVFGKHEEWVVRTPSVVAGLGVVLLVARLVSRQCGWRRGLLAGLIQATTVYTITYSRLAEQDMLLAFLIVAALCTFIELQGIGPAPPAARPRRLAIVFWVFLGLTNLLKGIALGAFLTAIVCVAWLALRRDHSAWRRMISPPGLLLGLGIALAWPLALSWRESGAWQLWLSFTFGHARGDFGTDPWWYYATTPWWQLLPWTAFAAIGAAVSLPRACRRSDSLERFIWLWAMLPIAVLSLSAHKHHHYLLPCLPAFTVFAVWGADALGSFLARHFAFRLALLGAAVFTVVGLVAAAAAVGHRLPGGPAGAWACAAIATLGVTVGGPLLLRNRLTAALAVAISCTVAVIVLVHFSVLPGRDPSRFDREFLRGVDRLVPPESPLFGTGGFAAARLAFYVRRPLTCVLEAKDLGRRLPPGMVYVLARGEDTSELAKRGAVEPLAHSPHSRGQRSPTDTWTLLRVADP